MTGKIDPIEPLIEQLLDFLGEDRERDGLKKTPKRVAQAYRDLTNGYTQSIPKIINDALFSENFDDLILIKDIEFCSLCEHHLLPFFGKAHIAYIPNGKVLGLSKIPRVVDVFARRLQLQEKMTQEIAMALMKYLKPKGVMILTEATHMCMMMRGVQKQLATTVTSYSTGVFAEDIVKQNKFFQLINGTK